MRSPTRLAGKTALALIVITAVWLSTNATGATEQPQDNWGEGFSPLEAHMALARDVPGFGGYFLNPSNGNLRVYLRDPVVERQALIDVMRASFGDQPFFASDDLESKIEILEGEYNFGDLEAWKEMATILLYDFPEIVYLDAQEIHNRLEIAITGEDAQAKIESAVVDLGIPSEAVRFVVRPRPELDLGDYDRPARAGIQIDMLYGGTCTLGIYARRSGVAGFLTNAHCTDNIGQVDGEQFYQQVYHPNKHIGEEMVDPPLTQGSYSGWCPHPYYFCRYTDAIWAKYDGPAFGDRGYIARPPLNSSNWNGTDKFKITNYASSTACEWVTKVGKTTGRTTGVVISTNVTQPSGSYPGGLLLFKSQNIAGYGRDLGDSGAPVFAITTGNNVSMRGMHWTGFNVEPGTRECSNPIQATSYYSDITKLISELQVFDFIAP